jgi:phosphopantetheine adenylyltransferase
VVDRWLRDAHSYLERKILESNVNIIDTMWREAEIFTLEMRIKSINNWLEHTDNLVKLFENDQMLATELRGMAGIVRSRRNDFDAEMLKLKAEHE